MMTDILQDLVDLVIIIFAISCFFYLRRKRASKLEWVAIIVSIVGLLLVNPISDFLWKPKNSGGLWKLCIAVWVLVLLAAAWGFYKSGAIRVFPIFAVGHSIVMADVALIVYLRLFTFYLFLAIGMAFILACIPLVRQNRQSSFPGST